MNCKFTDWNQTMINLTYYAVCCKCVKASIDWEKGKWKWKGKAEGKVIVGWEKGKHDVSTA